MAEQTEQPLRYRGSKTDYVDIAVRDGEFLGFNIDYAIHPSNIGCFIVRFVTHGENLQPSNYKHLTFRESKAQFLTYATENTMSKMFMGFRLNKIAMPVLKPAVRKHEVATFLDKFNVWKSLTEWVAAQVLAEGFTVTVQLESVIKNFLIVPATPEVNVECVIEYPDLKSSEQQAFSAGQAQKPEPEEEDEDDEDGEEKPWLN